jgi:hypothetical protein
MNATVSFKSGSSSTTLIFLVKVQALWLSCLAYFQIRGLIGSMAFVKAD